MSLAFPSRAGPPSVVTLKRDYGRPGIVWGWNPLTLPALLLGPTGVVSAWIVYRARPRALQNRAVAATLLITAFAIFVGYGLRPLVADREVAYGLYVTYLSLSSLVWLGWYFVAASFPLPWSRVLRSRPFAALAVVGSLVAMAITVLEPGFWFATFRYEPSVSSWIGGGFRMGFAINEGLLTVLPLASLLGAVQARRRARSELLRVRHEMFARACAAGVAAYSVPLLYVAAGIVLPLPAGHFVNFALWPALLVVFSVLAAYGFAKEQSMHAEVRSRTLVRRGTLAAIGLPALLIAFQVGTEILNETLGLAAGAVVMTAMLAFAVPLQRWVDRASASMVPGGPATRAGPLHDDPYWEQRKRRIFMAALDGALADGLVTARERDMLRHLQLELGIANDEAALMETQLQKA